MAGIRRHLEGIEGIVKEELPGISEGDPNEEA